MALWSGWYIHLCANTNCPTKKYLEKLGTANLLFSGLLQHLQFNTWCPPPQRKAEIILTIDWKIVLGIHTGEFLKICRNRGRSFIFSGLHLLTRDSGRLLQAYVRYLRVCRIRVALRGMMSETDYEIIKPKYFPLSTHWSGQPIWALRVRDETFNGKIVTYPNLP